MLQGVVSEFGAKDFKLFESWIERISSWADHDGLVQYLLGPMIAADPQYLPRPLRWAKVQSRWHQRAAAVSLIRSTQQHKNFDHVRRVTEMLLGSDDDMVLKGVGWLLREAAKFNREQTVAHLMTIRERTPRLVLRTACETLPPGLKERVLSKKAKTASAAKKFTSSARLKSCPDPKRPS